MPDRDVLAELPLLIADLYEAAGASRRRGEVLAAAAGQTQGRWQVLSVAGAGEWTVPRIARRLGISRQAVQRTADELRADGLVRADRNPHHRRSPLIRLTDAGRATLDAISARAEAYHVELAGPLSAEDVATARRVLRRIADDGQPESEDP